MAAGFSRTCDLDQYKTVPMSQEMPGVLGRIVRRELFPQAINGDFSAGFASNVFISEIK
jgi:hypothetical protein